MTECPELAAFEIGAPSPALDAHVATCASCRFVRELIEERGGDDDCERFEPLLAARADGTLGRAARNLLDRHLASCATCRAVAETLAPTADAEGDHASLPEVDPASYELGLEVARGGMGRILAARDLRVGRPVAVKELLGRSPRLAARFEREARVTARLQHPGVVPIYEIGRWPDGTPFYAMRMVDGRTLRAAIDAAPDLPARLGLLPAVIAASEAVAFAHSKRIIHRDLTPSNVLVGAYGETVVIDWGLAKDLADGRDEALGAEAGDERAGDGLTGIGAVIGTAAYMPPEQAHELPVDERADVYALGAILYHVLAGRAPYRAAGSDDLLEEVKAGPPPRIELVAPGVPRDLVSIVAKAMARAPAARYPSARELVDELRRFHTGRMVEAHAYTTGERVRRFVARNRGALVVTAAAVLVLAGLAAVSVERVLASRRHAHHTARTWLEERGRTEMLAGHPLKALAYLAAAFDPDARTPALDFLLAGALRELDDVEATLDCGDDVRYSAVSPDGRFVAAACRDVGRIWRLSDYQLAFTLGPAERGFDHVRYSHDGKTLAAIGGDGVARLYDTRTGGLRLALPHGDRVTLMRISFTPDDRRVVTTGGDGRAIVWDATSGARLRVIEAGGFGFLGVYGTLAPDGRTLLTVTMGGVGTGWDLETGARIGSLDHGDQILGGDVSPDGTLAATCGVDRRARVWDLAAREVKWTLAAHSDVVWKCVFSADGGRLFTTSNDGTAKVWDLARGTLVTSVDAGDIVWWGELSRDGAQLVTVSLDGAAKVWDAHTGALLTSHAFAGRAAHFSVDGRRLIMERGDGTLRVWRRPGGRQRHKLVPPAGGEATEVREVSVDGRRAVLARAGGLALWDVEAGRALGHPPLGEPFALAAGGTRLAARSGAGVVVLDVSDGRTLATLPVPAPRVLGLDRAGTRLVVGAPDGPPVVWDVARATPVATLTGARDAVLADDGRQALAWGEVSPPAVWRLDGAAAPRVLAEVGARVAPVGFSADGRRVALHVGGDASGTVLAVWDTASGRRRFTRAVANDAARFDPGGTMLTAIGADGVVEVVRVSDGTTVASFVGERLARAQVDAAGRLVVGMDKRDAAVSVVDASDGRVVASWPVLHSTLVTSEERFVLSRGAAWWTPDGGAIVARSGDVTVWDADVLPPDGAARIARAQREVPWRVIDGRLRWVSAGLRGRVTRGGVPVAGAVVTLTSRETPRFAAEVSLTTTSSRPRQRQVTTDARGEYQLTDLAPGEYALVARSPVDGASSAVIPRALSDLDTTIDLELDRGPDR